MMVRIAKNVKYPPLCLQIQKEVFLVISSFC